MIFFRAMPFMIGLMNVVVPLQLGVRDVAFPTLDSVSVWLTATGALLVNVSPVVGEFARTGWWLAALGLAGAFATVVVFAWRDRVEYEIPAEAVARLDRLNRASRLEALQQARRKEAA